MHAEHLVMGLLCAFVACAPPCLLLLSQRPGACVFVFVRVCVRVCVHVCVCVCVCIACLEGRVGANENVGAGARIREDALERPGLRGREGRAALITLWQSLCYTLRL